MTINNEQLKSMDNSTFCTSGLLQNIVSKYIKFINPSIYKALMHVGYGYKKQIFFWHMRFLIQ